MQPRPHTSVCKGRDQAPAAQAAPASRPPPSRPPSLLLNTSSFPFFGHLEREWGAPGGPRVCGYFTPSRADQERWGTLFLRDPKAKKHRFQGSGSGLRTETFQ